MFCTSRLCMKMSSFLFVRTWAMHSGLAGGHCRNCRLLNQVTRSLHFITRTGILQIRFQGFLKNSSPFNSKVHSAVIAEIARQPNCRLCTTDQRIELSFLVNLCKYDQKTWNEAKFQMRSGSLTKFIHPSLTFHLPFTTRPSTLLH